MTILLAGAACVATPVSAAASDSVAFSAGGQVDSSSAAFVGALLALPGATVGHGPALSGVIVAGGYSYDGGSRRIDAAFVGEELDAMYQFSSASTWANVGIGVRDMNTSLSRLDSTNRRRGVTTEAAATFYGGNVSGPWRVDWYGSYGTRLNDYSGRSSLTHAMSPSLRLGAEVSFEGDPTYNLHRLGPYIGVRVDKRSEIQFSAGYMSQSGRPGGEYIHTSIYRRL